MNDCIISIGSNINPKNNIKESLTRLQRTVHIVDTSSWLRTAPIGITNQARYINGAVHIHTTMSINSLTQYLKELEDTLGRDRTLPKFGPRTIDLDIIVWNNQIIDNDYYTRNFVKRTVDELWQANPI